MNKYFESSLISSDGKIYRVDLYGESYIGLNTLITGGSGNIVYVDNDWTDYLDTSQDVLVDASIFGVSFIAYNSASNRTEITLGGGFTYGSQTTIKNDFDGVNSFVPVFSPKIIDISTEWQDVEEYIVSPLMPSETTISYANVEETRSSIDTAFFDRFVESYLQSDDDELKVAVYLVDGTATLEWAGNLVVDLIEWSNESSPREYTFKAIDGINRLKNVFYEGDLNSLAVVKVIDVIKDVLNLNGLTSLWSNTDGYIAESIEYESPDVTSVTTSDSILDYTYIPENLLIPKDVDNSEVDFMTGYDVLYGILELFSCKMVHTEGRYWITQVRNYDGTQFIYRLFNKANNTYSTTFKTHLISNLRLQSGGKFTYFFGINRVSIETESAQVINFGGDVNNWQLQWNSGSTRLVTSNPSTIITPPEININIGDLPTGNIFTIQLNYWVATFLSTFVDIDIKLSITSGNKFIKGGNGTAPYWDDLILTSNQFWIKNIYQQFNDRGMVDFTTPVLPFDLDSAAIKIEFVSRLPGATSSAFWNQILNIDSVKILSSDTSKNGLETIYVENTNTKFTKNLELENLIINEGDTLVTANGLSVHTNYNTGGAAIIDRTRFWNGDFDVEGTLSTLRVLEAMSLQFRPIERYLGGFVGDYSPIESVSYNNKTFVCKRVIKSYGMDENNGDWFESTSSRVGLGSNNNYDQTDGKVYNEGLRMYIGNKDGVGILNENIAAIATTSMVVNLTDDVKIGDKLNFLNYDNKEIIGEVVLTSAHSAGSAVTISIESFTPVGPIPAGVEVVNAFKKLSTSEVYRFDTLQTSGVAGVPTIAVPMLSNEIRYVDGNIYIENATDVYKFTGTVYIPE
tara:strand:+ start:1759 stop:4323 length:2565 start_codon:yes stop_codon:yes gene_type:complete